MPEKTNPDVPIPKWFLQMTAVGLTLCAATFLPLEVWQTRSLMRVEVKMESLDRWAATLDGVREEQIRRTSHVHKVEELSGRVDALHERVLRLERKTQ